MQKNGFINGVYKVEATVAGIEKMTFRAQLIIRSDNGLVLLTSIPLRCCQSDYGVTYKLIIFLIPLRYDSITLGNLKVRYLPNPPTVFQYYFSIFLIPPPHPRTVFQCNYGVTYKVVILTGRQVGILVRSFLLQFAKNLTLEGVLPPRNASQPPLTQ